jgi:hypothetical protein
VKRYRLSGNHVADLSAGTTYNIATLPEGCTPIIHFAKEISIRNGVNALLYISTSGTVQLTPRATVTNGFNIAIDEVFI